MNFPDVDVDEADVAPIDAVNDVDEQPGGGVLQFVRMAGQHYFVSFRVNFYFAPCGLVTLTVLLQTFKNSHFTP
uniref:Uncharacterized protein n=1 Tax=Helianthus annuus TaxID=4232 RepID=A0A251TYP9_HELAN